MKQLFEYYLLSLIVIEKTSRGEGSSFMKEGGNDEITFKVISLGDSYAEPDSCSC